MGKLRVLAVAASVAVLAACGGGGDGGSGQPPPPDLSGVWSGAWQGSDPTLGLVSGTWTVTITQGATSASGPGTLLGDVDCMDGQMQTNPNTQTSVTGSVTRAPCGTVNWTLTALNVSAGAAAGTWTNAQTQGSGTMSGTRIANLTGPRIDFVSPPGAKPGAWVTVVGQSLSGLSTDGLVFNQTTQPMVASADTTRIVARLPRATTGPVRVTTAAGSALSPFVFNTDVISPPLEIGNAIEQESQPAAVAVSPDGRKIYVAYRGNNRVSVIRASTLVNINTQFIVGGSPRSIAVSPDGKRIYVAVTSVGVLIMDAALASEVNRVTVSTISADFDNPQGIAVSPDGRMLAVSDGALGGSVRVFTIVGDTLTLLATHTTPSLVPLGVAFAPDGTQAYVAAADPAGTTDSLRVFDPLTGTLLDEDLVGDMPTAVAVHPTGDLVFVSNRSGGTVSVYNINTQAVGAPVPVGTQPTGIAVAPDGARVYVVNQGSATLNQLDGATGSVMGSTGVGNTSPLAIAINPSGTTAYVTRLGNSSVVEVGGMRTLTVVRGGTGIGGVTSSPVGINCGTSCQAQFLSGTHVILTVTPASGSFFAGWSGAGCGFDVNLTSNLTCTANFNSGTPPPSQQTQHQQGDNCFIATAAYGSDMAHEVQVLREFRDYMTNYAAGRAFVGFYYRHSPPIAERIRGSEGARAAVRVVLWPVVWTVAHPAHALVFVLSCALLGWSWKRRGSSARAG